jgi:hypothetical protein
MKLLFDENLSPKLPRLLSALFPNSAHVRECGLKGFPDQRRQFPSLHWTAAAGHPMFLSMRSLWLKAAAILAGVWLIVAGVIWIAHKSKATPESVARYLEAHPVEGRPQEERGKVIESLAQQMNQLDAEERRELRMGRKLDGFFKSLRPEEQSRLLDLTLPAGFRQMMDSFNKMTPQRRKAFVERALADMKRRGEEEGTPAPDDANMQKIIGQGLHSFYSEASAETKMDLAPLVEQMQRNLQGLR